MPAMDPVAERQLSLALNDPVVPSATAGVQPDETTARRIADGVTELLAEVLSGGSRPCGEGDSSRPADVGKVKICRRSPVKVIVSTGDPAAAAAVVETVSASPSKDSPGEQEQDGGNPGPEEELS